MCTLMQLGRTSGRSFVFFGFPGFVARIKSEAGEVQEQGRSTQKLQEAMRTPNMPQIPLVGHNKGYST